MSASATSGHAQSKDPYFHPARVEQTLTSTSSGQALSAALNVDGTDRRVHPPNPAAERRHSHRGNEVPMGRQKRRHTEIQPPCAGPIAIGPTRLCPAFSQLLGKLGSFLISRIC